MEGSFKDKYSFVGEWYDSQASLNRRFNVFYYPFDDTIEMYDIKNRKTFVRRYKVNGVTLNSFYIGCTLQIFGRLVKIIDFGCEDTRRRLQKDLQVTFAMTKPLPIRTTGKILTYFHEHGLRVTRIKQARVTPNDIHIIFRHMINDPAFPFILDLLTDKPVFGLELVGKDAVATCLKIVGDADPLKAEPGTIRALYGTDISRNCLHVASTTEGALEDLEYFFPPPPMRALRLRLTATLSNCTLCLLKPHAVFEGKLGAVLEAIDEGGFDVTALNMMTVESVNASEFFEVYKGIVPEVKGMVDELSSGPCVAMEIVVRNKNQNTAVEFRKLVGPSDPEIARLLRPHTLRAKFGINKVKNAIHCSDLAEDGLLEVEYFFKILDL